MEDGEEQGQGKRCLCQWSLLAALRGGVWFVPARRATPILGQGVFEHRWFERFRVLLPPTNRVEADAGMGILFLSLCHGLRAAGAQDGGVAGGCLEVFSAFLLKQFALSTSCTAPGYVMTVAVSTPHLWGCRPQRRSRSLQVLWRGFDVVASGRLA